MLLDVHVPHQLCRVGTGEKVDLRAVLVADAGQLPLIQQRAPNLTVGFGLDAPYRLLLVEVRVEQVWAEVAYLLVVLPRREDAD